MARFNQISVIGAGLMGHGIALCLARAGCTVALVEPSAPTRANAHARIADSLKLVGANDDAVSDTLGRVNLHEHIADAVSDAEVVFEAAPEKLPLKQAIFAEVEANAPSDCILASNTSVIQIGKIMGGLEHRQRCLGTHWWNPPHMIPLVEVVSTDWTDAGAVTDMCELLTGIGKKPVVVEKDVPGFIGNRLQHALWREAISLVEQGICSAEAVDDVVKHSFGRRLAVLGPLENADLVGIELTRDIHQNVLFDLDTSTSPSPYLQSLLDSGRRGADAGAGFRTWTAKQAAAARRNVVEHLRKLEDILPQ